jgi:hypothetical protein
LRDQLPFSKLLDYWSSESGDYAHCSPSTADQYFLAGNETNVILRQDAYDGGVALSWFVDENSQLHEIQSGGVYICLAQKYYVLDGRSDEEMAQYAGHTSPEPATCP